MTSMPTADRLGSYVKRAEQALTVAKNAALKPAGVTVPQYSALLFVTENPGISAAALARLCGVTPPTMNTVLGNLQERGLVERRPHAWHRNVLETHITDAGEAVMRDADARAVRVERRVAEAFSETEGATLRALLIRLAEAFDAVREETAVERKD